LLTLPVICYLIETGSTGMGAGGEWDGNNRWAWEGNKTRLNLGSGMGMNHWEWD